MSDPRTLFDKIWSDHVIVVSPQGEDLLGIDFNLINEGQSFLAFDQLRGSFDFGLTSTDRRDSGFEMIFGLGTEPFGMGGHVTSVRLAIAGRTGF